MNRRDFLKASALAVGATLVSKMGNASQTMNAISNMGSTGSLQHGAASVIAPNSGKQDNPRNIPSVTLNNGLSMPQFGFGVWTLAENTTPSVAAAIESGYRLVDTAQAYNNEKETYEGIKQTGIARKDVFITSKISPQNMRTPPQKDSIDKSIEALGGEYIDLFLLHWPVRDFMQETWGVLEEYVANGTIKSLGLSNFNPHHIEDLLKFATVKPVINQIEIHPYHTQVVNVDATRSYDLAAQCWSPLAQGRVAEDETIIAIGKKYNKSAAQVTLRWEIQRGLITIPRSKNPSHIAENVEIFDFVLSHDDMMAIHGLNQNARINPQNDPDNFPW